MGSLATFPVFYTSSDAFDLLRTLTAGAPFSGSIGYLNNLEQHNIELTRAQFAT